MNCAAALVLHKNSFVLQGFSERPNIESGSSITEDDWRVKKLLDGVSGPGWGGLADAASHRLGFKFEVKAAVINQRPSGGSSALCRLDHLQPAHVVALPC
jgi:hypothetical protein